MSRRVAQILFPRSRNETLRAISAQSKPTTLSGLIGEIFDDHAHRKVCHRSDHRNPSDL